MRLLTLTPSLARTSKFLIAIGLIIAIAGCAAPSTEQTSANNKRARGAISGAIAGGVLGYTTFGSGTGQVISSLALGGVGVYAGVGLADKVNHWDRETMRQATYQSLAVTQGSEPTYWQSSYTGNRGEIRPTGSYLDDNGRICREYNVVAMVDGRELNDSEVACLADSGVWVIYEAGN